MSRSELIRREIVGAKNLLRKDDLERRVLEYGRRKEEKAKLNGQIPPGRELRVIAEIRFWDRV